jgi:hypothetical protein
LIPSILAQVALSNNLLTNPYKVAALCRGLVNNDTSFTGGILVLGSNKVFTSTGAPSFMPICNQNVANKMKIESGAKQAPSTIFTCAADATYGLMTYISLDHSHSIEYAWVHSFTSHYKMAI